MFTDLNEDTFKKNFNKIMPAEIKEATIYINANHDAFKEVFNNTLTEKEPAALEFGHISEIFLQVRTFQLSNKLNRLLCQMWHHIFLQGVGL